MDITTYQREVTRTMRTDLKEYDPLTMLALGVAGEAGEVVELVKKYVFHNDVLDKKEVEKELGDLLWYITNMATELDLSMENILENNVEKLKKRYPKGFNSEDSKARVDTK